MTTVTINKIDECEKKADSTKYWKIHWNEEVEGKTMGSVWDKAVLGDVKVGDTVDLTYKVSNGYINISAIKVVLTGQTKALEPRSKDVFVPASKGMTPAEACKLAGEVFKGLEENGVKDFENKTLNTILIKLMR